MAVIISFILCVLIWGSTWYAIELQLGVVAKEWSLFYRFAIAAVVMFAICIFRRQKISVPITEHKWMIGTGISLFAGCYVLTYAGAQFLTSGLVAITFSLLSFLNILNARIFLKNPIQLNMLFAALIGILGLILIFMPEIRSLDLSDETTVGLLLCIAATVIASIGNTLAGLPQSKRIPLLSFNAWSMLYGSLSLLVYALASGEPMTIDPRAPYILSLLHLSVAGTVIAFTLYVWLIGNIGLGRTAYISVLVPIVALIISTFYENFIWTTEAVIGLSLVIGGNIALIKRKPTQPTMVTAD